MTEFTSSVSPKGQITLPLEIRRRLKIKPKDKVSIRLEGEEVRITPAGSRLEASFQAVPALDPPRRWNEVTGIASEGHAREAAQEGL